MVGSRRPFAGLLGAALLLAGCSDIPVEPAEPATWSKDICNDCGPGLLTDERGTFSLSDEIWGVDEPAEQAPVQPTKRRALFQETETGLYVRVAPIE
ncbi:MAG: hypothetical protein AAF074_00210 [Pseudomonadota bacterium]